MNEYTGRTEFEVATGDGKQAAKALVEKLIENIADNKQAVVIVLQHDQDDVVSLDRVLLSNYAGLDTHVHNHIGISNIGFPKDDDYINKEDEFGAGDLFSSISESLYIDATEYAANPQFDIKASAFINIGVDESGRSSFNITETE